jgi:hypothetical protein
MERIFYRKFVSKYHPSRPTVPRHRRPQFDSSLQRAVVTYFENLYYHSHIFWIRIRYLPKILQKLGIQIMHHLCYQKRPV